MPLPERTFSQLEEGERNPRQQREEGKSVVAELIQYGLQHGIGRGLPVALNKSTSLFGMAPSMASLYEPMEAKPEDGQQNTDRRASKSYVQRVKDLRERKRASIVHHVEG